MAQEEPGHEQAWFRRYELTDGTFIEEGVLETAGPHGRANRLALQLRTMEELRSNISGFVVDGGSHQAVIIPREMVRAIYVLPLCRMGRLGWELDAEREKERLSWLRTESTR